MDSKLRLFLTSALGADAAGALKKAAERSDSLGSVLGARTIIGWLGLAARWGFDGDIPGLPGSYLRFAKAENGFEGEIRLGKSEYQFRGVDLPHVAAALAVVLGADQTPDEDLRDAELAALGQNIDLLLKTQVIKSEKSSEEESSKTCPSCEEGNHQRCSGKGCDCCSDDLEKGGTTAPGEAATQKPPAGPVDGGFTAPKATAPMRAKKKFGTKLTMSQASSKCSVCDAPQFAGDIFVGCHCLKDLAKHAEAEATDGGYFIVMDPAFWSREDATLLLDIVGEGA